MLSKLSVIALLAATAVASALPADSQNSVSKRQEENWNLWFVALLIMRFCLFSYSLTYLTCLIRNLYLYESGCDDEPTEHFGGHDDQTFPCTGSVTGWHNVKMENLAATGHKVLLYSDGGCLSQIGEVTKDNSCYAAPSDVSAQNSNSDEATS
jgi:hypothetical protein